MAVYGITLTQDSLDVIAGGRQGRWIRSWAAWRAARRPLVEAGSIGAAGAGSEDVPGWRPEEGLQVRWHALHRVFLG